MPRTWRAEPHRLLKPLCKRSATTLTIPQFPIDRLISPLGVQSLEFACHGYAGEDRRFSLCSEHERRLCCYLQLRKHRWAHPGSTLDPLTEYSDKTAAAAQVREAHQSVVGRWHGLGSPPGRGPDPTRVCSSGLAGTPLWRAVPIAVCIQHPLSRPKLTALSVNDWIYGIRTESPDQNLSHSMSAEPWHEAERLRVIYQLITEPETEGGAGITPKAGEWKQVDDIFPLHDHTFNTAWIKEISSNYLLKPAQLDEIRNRFGEQVGQSNGVMWVLNIYSDCVLLRVHPILFHLPHVYRRLRRHVLVPPWAVYSDIRLCQLPVVRRLHRVLETPGGRPCHPLGRPRRLPHRRSPPAIQAREGGDRSRNGRENPLFPSDDEAVQTNAAGPVRLERGATSGVLDRCLLWHRSLRLRGLRWAHEICAGKTPSSPTAADLLCTGLSSPRAF